MGEAQRKRALGLGPQNQINVDLSNTKPHACECGCLFFTPVIMIYVVSALLSPTGQELIAQNPVLTCVECKKVLKIE